MFGCSSLQTLSRDLLPSLLDELPPADVEEVLRSQPHHVENFKPRLNRAFIEFTFFKMDTVQHPDAFIGVRVAYGPDRESVFKFEDFENESPRLFLKRIVESPAFLPILEGHRVEILLHKCFIGGSLINLLLSTLAPMRSSKLVLKTCTWHLHDEMRLINRLEPFEVEIFAAYPHEPWYSRIRRT